MLGLLGPNGAGKTTTVRMIDDAEGTHQRHRRGSPVTTSSPSPTLVRRNMGLTGQAATVDELLTGRENLRMIGGLLRARRNDLSRDDGDQLLERFSIDRGRRPAGQDRTPAACGAGSISRSA